jgi:hypothetical protein
MENIKTIFDYLSAAVDSKNHFKKYNEILDRQYYNKLFLPETYETNKTALIELNQQYNKFVESVKNNKTFIPLNGPEVKIKNLKDWAAAFELLFGFTGQYDKYVYDSRTQGELTDVNKQDILNALSTHCKNKTNTETCVFPSPCKFITPFYISNADFYIVKII